MHSLNPPTCSNRAGGETVPELIYFYNITIVMKKGIHPEYRDVIFWDLTSDHKFLSRSTIQTKETIEFEGNTYPVVKVEVSSESHPFYTGKNVLLDTAGRVDKFLKRYGKK